MTLRDNLRAAVARCAPQATQRATNTTERATEGATTAQQPAAGPQERSLSDASGHATPAQLPCCTTPECDPRKVVRVAQAGNPLMTREHADRTHWPAWDGDGIDRTVGRVHLFLRPGNGADDADDLAERWTLRDREGDDQRICIECSHLSDKGRCSAAATGRLVGADMRLEPVPTILHGCDAFELRKGPP